MKKNNIIPIFIPHLGCPNDCVFCNQRRISGVSSFDVNNVVENIEEYLKIFNRGVDVELAFYGGSFTAIDVDLQETLLQIANQYLENARINSIRISTRPDAISPSILDRLKKYGVSKIELGVQSLDEEVLRLSKRGHNSKSVYEAVKLIKSYNFQLGLQQMVGLPGDTKDKSIYTTREIIKLQPDFVRIYPTLVIKDTELADMLAAGKYEPLSLENAVDIVSELILLYNAWGVEIIRVGLQSAENLRFDRDVLAGPLHDAFRELAESKLLYNLIKFSNIMLEGTPTLTGNNKIAPLIAGQKSENKEKLINFYNLKGLKINRDNGLGNVIVVSQGDKKEILDLNSLTDSYLKQMELRCI